MAKSKLMRVLLIAGSALMLVGVALMTWMLATEDERNVIEVRLGEGETKTLEFENLCLIPGEECEYVVELEAESVKQYDLTLDFAETEEGTLKHFARVRIIANGEILYDDLLATAFDSELPTLPVDFYEEKNTELKILYYLPLDVGNEAKNAQAIFDLLLTASNE